MDHRAAIESLADEVSCPICHLDFEDPRILPCGHYYCKECIFGLVTNALPKLSFPCPECRRTTAVLESNPENLPKALFLNRVKSVLQGVLSAREVRPAAQCAVHGEAARLYCADCHLSVCQRCTTSQEHLQHQVQPALFAGLIKAELARLAEQKGKIGTALKCAAAGARGAWRSLDTRQSGF